jgi:hypothetical protein
MSLPHPPIVFPFLFNIPSFYFPSSQYLSDYCFRLIYLPRTLLFLLLSFRLISLPLRPSRLFLSFYFFLFLSLPIVLFPLILILSFPVRLFPSSYFTSLYIPLPIGFLPHITSLFSFLFSPSFPYFRAICIISDSVCVFVHRFYITVSISSSVI